MTTNIIIPADLYKNNEVIERATALTSGSPSRKFVNWEQQGNSVKSDYTRADYDYFRSGTLPNDPKGRIAICNIGYRKNGIIRNVIDLMGDFASQGIRIQHPVPAIERFYKDWANRVGLKDRSERFERSFNPTLFA